MTPDVLVRLGFAVGRTLAATDGAPQVLVSKDTRLSGYMVDSTLEAGLAAAGADVLLSGPLPTVWSQGHALFGAGLSNACLA